MTAAGETVGSSPGAPGEWYLLPAAGQRIDVGSLLTWMGDTPATDRALGCDTVELGGLTFPYLLSLPLGRLHSPDARVPIDSGHKAAQPCCKGVYCLRLPGGTALMQGCLLTLAARPHGLDMRATTDSGP